jgi:chromosome segregation ATPase
MGQRLLIVDSDRAFLQEQRVTLESAYDVEVISTVDGVVERLESGQFAATLIAVEVGENRGYGLCSTIRKNTALKDVKIALISSKATEDEYKRHQSLKGRADLYLHKPIAPSALTASLGGLVPPRPVDPNNPLGDLADGADFLDELKDLEVDALFSDSGLTPKAPAPMAPPVPEPVPSPLATHHIGSLNPVSTAPPRTATSDLLQLQMDGLHEKMRGLEAELQGKDDTIARLQAEVQHLQRDKESVTVNLEALERQQAEAQHLKAKLAEAEAQARSLENRSGDEEALRTQLKAALEEKQDHLHQIEDLSKQVADKSQRTIEALKDRDRWQGQVLELEPFKAQAESALRELREWRDRAQAAEARLGAMEEMLQRLPSVERELAARSGELEKATAEVQAMAAAMSDLTARNQELETAQKALAADLGTARQEAAGLEATMKGQGMQMAQLQARIQEAEASLARAQAEASEAKALAADAQAELAVKAENLEKMGNEIFSISAQRNDLQQRLEDSEHAREQERMELLQGLDTKESELQRVMGDLALAQREGQELQGQLADRGDRLGNLAALLEEASEKLRKGADLARG